MYEIAYGNKYEQTKNLDIKDVAKLVRADIKLAIKAGTLPVGLKCSVTISRYAGGQSLDIKVTELPATFKVWSAEYLLEEARDPHSYSRTERVSEEHKALLKNLDAILASYNFDGSDVQSDYFHVRFYGHAKIDWELEAACKATELEAARKADSDAQVCRAAVRALCKGLTSLVAACEAYDSFEPDLSGLTRKTITARLPESKRVDLSGQYNGPASLATTTFQAHGLTHIARRFYRQDRVGTGKIELYLVEPGIEIEEFFRYVDEQNPSKVDIQAIEAIAKLDASYVPPLAFDQTVRARLIELA